MKKTILILLFLFFISRNCWPFFSRVFIDPIGTCKQKDTTERCLELVALFGEAGDTVKFIQNIKSDLTSTDTFHFLMSIKHSQKIIDREQDNIQYYEQFSPFISCSKCKPLSKDTSAAIEFESVKNAIINLAQMRYKLKINDYIISNTCAALDEGCLKNAEIQLLMEEGLQLERGISKVLVEFYHLNNSAIERFIDRQVSNKFAKHKKIFSDAYAPYGLMDVLSVNIKDRKKVRAEANKKKAEVFNIDDDDLFSTFGYFARSGIRNSNTIISKHQTVIRKATNALKFGDNRNNNARSSIFHNVDILFDYFLASEDIEKDSLEEEFLCYLLLEHKAEVVDEIISSIATAVIPIGAGASLLKSARTLKSAHKFLKIKKARQAVPKKVEVTYCFTPETLIHNPDGIKEISHIEQGDLVYSYDFYNQSLSIGEVSGTSTNWTRQLLDIKISGSVISSTLTHSYWISLIDKWVMAQDLQAGMHLTGIGGETFEILSIKKRDGFFKVINFESPKHHNYFVGPLGILVHNGDPTQVGKIRNQYNGALRDAIDWLHKAGGKPFYANKPVMGKFGTQVGNVIGMQSADEELGFRVECDKRSGCHINVWNYNAPKGQQKGPHFLFNGDEKTVKKITRRFMCN